MENDFVSLFRTRIFHVLSAVCMYRDINSGCYLWWNAFEIRKSAGESSTFRNVACGDKSCCRRNDFALCSERCERFRLFCFNNGDLLSKDFDFDFLFRDFDFEWLTSRPFGIDRSKLNRMFVIDSKYYNSFYNFIFGSLKIYISVYKRKWMYKIFVIVC